MTVAAVNILCGSVTVSDILIVTTNVTTLVGPSITTLSLVTTSISSTMMLFTATSSSAPCVYMPTQSQSGNTVCVYDCVHVNIYLHAYSIL